MESSETNEDTERVDSALDHIEFVQNQLDNKRELISKDMIDTVNDSIRSLKEAVLEGNAVPIERAITDLKRTSNELSSALVSWPVSQDNLNTDSEEPSQETQVPPSTRGGNDISEEELAVSEINNPAIEDDVPNALLESILTKKSEETANEVTPSPWLYATTGEESQETANEDPSTIVVDPPIETTEEEEAQSDPDPLVDEFFAMPTEASSINAPVINSGVSRGAINIIIGLGGTGVQVVEQFLRAETHARNTGSVSLMPDDKYDYILLDTSSDLDPANEGFSHTREGNEHWLELFRMVRLANLRGGASRMPPIAELVAESTLDNLLGDEDGPFYYQFRTPLNHMVFLVHSASGGSGGALAHCLSSWLNVEKDFALNLVSFVSLNEVARTGQQNQMLANSMYNFPKLNESIAMAVLVDNQAVKQKIDSPRTNEKLARYMKEIERTILGGCPEYLAQTGDQQYLLADRYIHRMIAVLTRLPVDIGNIFTGYFSQEESYNAGAKWVVPYIYPIDGDYEDDYDLVPPALLTLRALTEGNLCNVNEKGPQLGSKAIVVFEMPDNYRYASVVKDQASRIVAEILKIDQDQDVQVYTVPSRGNGVSVLVFWLHPRTDFLEDWCTNTEDAERMGNLQTEWANRVRSAASEDDADKIDSGIRGLPRAWVRAYRGIITILAANNRLSDNSESEEELESKLSDDAHRKIIESANHQIGPEFMEFARKVGLRSRNHGD